MYSIKRLLVLFFLMGFGIFSNAQTSTDNSCSSDFKKDVLLDSVQISEEYSIQVQDVKKIKKLVSPYSDHAIIQFRYMLSTPSRYCGAFLGEMNGDKFSKEALECIHAMIKGDVLTLFCIKVKTKTGQVAYLPTKVLVIE